MPSEGEVQWGEMALLRWIGLPTKRRDAIRQMLLDRATIEQSVDPELAADLRRAASALVVLGYAELPKIRKPYEKRERKKLRSRPRPKPRSGMVRTPKDDQVLEVVVEANTEVYSVEVAKLLGWHGRTGVGSASHTLRRLDKFGDLASRMVLVGHNSRRYYRPLGAPIVSNIKHNDGAVLEALEAHQGWMSAEEVAEQLVMTEKRARESLTRLRGADSIESKTETEAGALVRYYRARMEA